MASIVGTVGLHSGNDPFDVAVVQKLLTEVARLKANAALDPQRTDGKLGDTTVPAIKEFQRSVMLMQSPDGKIAKNGATIKRLNTEAGEVDSSPDTYPIKPDNVHQLGPAARDSIFSTFVITDKTKPNFPGYVDDPGPAAADADNIRILGNWEASNISAVVIPQLAKIKNPAHTRKRFHRIAIPQLVGLWQAWDDAGLVDRINTFDGAFNARYMRKASHVTAHLSNHCWGTAFDINASTNHLFNTPAISWEPGCVFDLVSLAVDWGFFWGGWFPNGRMDGMHFEVRTLTNVALSTATK